MQTIDISYISLVIGLLLLAVPLYGFYRLGVRMVGSTILAAVRMVVQLFLIGLYLKYLFILNSAWVNIAWVLVMVLVAAFTAASRTRLRRRMIVAPLCSGMFCSALVVGLYFLVFVLRLSNPFDARYFIPILGLLMGNMLTSSVVALNTYYDALEREQHYYYYLLGNGASHMEAVMPFIRRGIEKAFAPCIANMAVMGIVALPGTMIGQIMGGSAPDVAIKYQMMIIVIALVASMLSIVLTLYLADRRSFDSYGRLRRIRMAAVLVLCLVFATSCSGRRPTRPLMEIRNAPVERQDKAEKPSTDVETIGLPALRPSSGEQVLRRTGYTVSYNSEHKLPNWVAWKLTADHTGGPYKRSGIEFHEDPDINGPQATDQDYVRSGYDRGHMCPSGDNKWSEQAQEESFLLTNICPQAPSLNRGDWNELENKCRKWAREWGEIYIVCGPIVYNKGTRAHIGRGRVTVPNAFFKVVLCMTGKPKAIGFIYKNDDANRPLGDYVNSVDEVERITGYNFFSDLPDDVEDKIESKKDLTLWTSVY